MMVNKARCSRRVTAGALGIILGVDGLAPFMHTASPDCSAFPNDVTAVAVNLTMSGGTAWSFLTVWDDGPMPEVSSLNWTAEQGVMANGTVLPIGADGAIRTHHERTPRRDDQGGR